MPRTFNICFKKKKNLLKLCPFELSGHYNVESYKEIAKTIYYESFKNYDDLCAPYSTVIDIDKDDLPSPEAIKHWNGEKFSQTLRHNQSNPNYNVNFRQLLHVGYKVASKMGKSYLDALKSNEDVISKNVTENIFHRHIEPLFLNKH